MELTDSRGTRADDRRLYVDGRRVTLERFNDIKSASRLDCFYSTRRNGRMRLHCSARPMESGR